MRDREEIVTAFIAKHGCGPDDAIQIQDGVRWYVRLKDDADRWRENRAKEIRERDATNACPTCGN